MACHGSVRAGGNCYRAGNGRAAPPDGSHAAFRPMQSRPPDLCRTEARRYRAAVRAAMTSGAVQAAAAGACRARSGCWASLQPADGWLQRDRARRAAAVVWSTTMSSMHFHGRHHRRACRSDGLGHQDLFRGPQRLLAEPQAYRRLRLCAERRLQRGVPAGGDTVHGLHRPPCRSLRQGHTRCAA